MLNITAFAREQNSDKIIMWWLMYTFFWFHIIQLQSWCHGLTSMLSLSFFTFCYMWPEPVSKCVGLYTISKVSIIAFNPLDSKGTIIIVLHRIIRSWYTGRWWVGCYMVQRGVAWAGWGPTSPLLAVPHVTVNPSTASVPITVLLYDGPLLCGFNAAIKVLANVVVFVALGYASTCTGGVSVCLSVTRCYWLKTNDRRPISTKRHQRKRLECVVCGQFISVANSIQRLSSGDLQQPAARLLVQTGHSCGSKAAGV